jgi:hypothetical protein
LRRDLCIDGPLVEAFRQKPVVFDETDGREKPVVGLLSVPTMMSS